MTPLRRPLLALALAAAFASQAHAQSWRTFTAQRGIAKEDALHVDVSYGLGKLTLRAADPSVLYDLNARFDADNERILRRYDAATSTLYVGADSATAERFGMHAHLFSGSGRSSEKGGYLTVALARGIPLNLGVKLSAGAGEVELGDLWLSHLVVLSTMSDATVDFRTANPQPMKEAVFDASIGGITIKRLGNARAERVYLNVGIGGAEVDMRGAWTGETTIVAVVTMGGITLQVPRDAGVKITTSTTLAGLDTKGFERRDGAYFSPNYATAARKLNVTGGATMAGVAVSWVEP